MTKRTLGLALAAALLLPTLTHAQAPAATPAAPAAAKRANTQANGKVTAVDTAKRTITITSRRNPDATTLTLAADAKVYVQQPATLADVKAGDRIDAYGTATPTSTSVDANRLVILTPAPADAGKRKPNAKAGFRKNRVEGTVTATTPALTITTPGGVTLTVKTTDATKVARTVAGTLSDVAVGATVQARTSGEGTSLTASEVRVMPANAKRRGGGKKRARQGAQTTAPAAVPVTPATP